MKELEQSEKLRRQKVAEGQIKMSRTKIAAIEPKRRLVLSKVIGIEQQLLF